MTILKLKNRIEKLHAELKLSDFANKAKDKDILSRDQQITAQAGVIDKMQEHIDELKNAREMLRIKVASYASPQVMGQALASVLETSFKEIQRLNHQID